MSDEYDRLRRIEDVARRVNKEWYALDFEERLLLLREALDGAAQQKAESTR